MAIIILSHEDREEYHHSCTQGHIARYLARPAILRDPEVRALLREVCREIETSNEDEAMNQG